MTTSPIEPTESPTSTPTTSVSTARSTELTEFSTLSTTYIKCRNENEEWYDCGPICQPICGFVDMCPDICVSTCMCTDGFIRDYDGTCISIDKCDARLSRGLHGPQEEVEGSGISVYEKGFEEESEGGSEEGSGASGVSLADVEM